MQQDPVAFGRKLAHECDISGEAQDIIEATFGFFTQEAEFALQAWSDERRKVA